MGNVQGLGGGSWDVVGARYSRVATAVRVEESNRVGAAEDDAV